MADCLFLVWKMVPMKKKGNSGSHRCLLAKEASGCTKRCASLSQLCFPLVIPAQTFMAISVNTAHGFKTDSGTLFALFIGNTSSHQKINETPGKTSHRAKAWWDSSHLPTAPCTVMPAALTPPWAAGLENTPNPVLGGYETGS